MGEGGISELNAENENITFAATASSFDRGRL